MLDSNLSREEDDQMVEKLIRAKFDAELKGSWEKKLKDEFDISKSARVVNINRRRKRLVFIIGAAAGFLLLFVSFFLLQPSSPDASSLASAYLEEVEELHPGSMKGVAENQENRERAIEAFNQKNYVAAAEYFSSIDGQTDEDLYYNALAYLFSDNLKEAISKFEAAKEKDTTYQQEINWYLAIALLLNDQQQQAKALLSEIPPSGWNYDKARKFLKAMD